MRKRVLLAKARVEWSYSINLWSDSMHCYAACLASGLPPRYAEYYLDQASRLRVDAEDAAEQFGDAAKRKPTFFDKLLIVCFGWLIKD